MIIEEAEGGQVYLENDFLYFKANKGWEDADVDLSKLEKVYAEINYNGVPILFFYDSRQHRIPVNAKGFYTAYSTLSKRFKFDDNVYSIVVSSKERQKKPIYNRRYDQNYHITDDFSSIQSGLKVLSPIPEIISWDLPFNKLIESDFIELKRYTHYVGKQDYGRNYLMFKYPVQLGPIIINELFANVEYLNPKSPIIEFYTKLRSKNGDDLSYHDAKSLLSKLMPQNERTVSYERPDANHFNFIIDQINFAITYWYDDVGSYESNYTDLRIKNFREYPELYKNEDWSSISSIENYVIFDCTLWTSDKYKENDNIKEKPRIIKEISNSNPCIWFNRDKNTIGFSGPMFCQEFGTNEIESIRLKRVVPFSMCSSYLEIKLNNKKWQSILSFKYKDFEPYIDRIESVIGKKLIIEHEYGGR